MSIFDGLLEGAAVAFSVQGLLFVFLGVLIGTVIGVLPGLGPTATIALLLPITYTLDPTTAIIMLAGIYYGSMYGGTITAVLLRLPGEASSVVTSIDGHELAKQGRGGPALGVAALSSFVGGTLAVVGLTLFAAPVAGIAVKFGPPEYFALAALGLVLVTYLGRGHPVKSLAMAGAGIVLATIGQDPIAATPRFTFDQVQLLDGLDFIAVAMGLFGVGEVLHNIEQSRGGQPAVQKVHRILPTRADLRESRGAIGRGSVLGFLIGMLPGGGGAISSMASYGIEKQIAKNPRRFGRGALEGVAGPESANNASSTSAFIPLLTLGLPSNVVLAVIFGALLIQGVNPGPDLLTENPEIFWGVIVSMYVGNLILLVLNMPLVGAFIQILRVRVGILGAGAVLVTMVGVFSVNNDPFDMWVVLAFGLVGWLMKKTGFEPGPLVLAFVLGPILEQAFRQSMLLSRGDPSIFVTRPYSGAVIGLLAAILVANVVIRRVAARAQSRLTEGPNAGDEHGESADTAPHTDEDLTYTGSRTNARSAPAADRIGSDPKDDND